MLWKRWLSLNFVHFWYLKIKSLGGQSTFQQLARVLSPTPTPNPKKKCPKNFQSFQTCQTLALLVFHRFFFSFRFRFAPRRPWPRSPEPRPVGRTAAACDSPGCGGTCAPPAPWYVHWKVWHPSPSSGPTSGGAGCWGEDPPWWNRTGVMTPTRNERWTLREGQEAEFF